MNDLTRENLSIWQAAALENRELRLLSILQAAQKTGDDWNAGHTRDIGVWRTDLATAASPLLPPADAFLHGLTVDEQLAFCRAVLARCPHFPHEESKPTRAIACPSHPLVATLGGAFFEDALKGFLSIIPNAKTVRADSFSEVLETVAEGQADFAMLPIEDQRGGKLLAFYEECDRLELHINCVADIVAPHGGRSVQFALISRFSDIAFAFSGEWMLECRVFDEDAFTLADFLSAAATCGLSLIRIDSFSDPHDEGRFAHHVLFATKEPKSALLEAYMAIRLPRSFVVEHYLHI